MLEQRNIRLPGGKCGIATGLTGAADVYFAALLLRRRETSGLSIFP
jgi:hypothetical protein